MSSADTKPTTHNGNLAKLPRALAPLIERPQWCVWRWTRVGGRWTKPPFQPCDPQTHASTKGSDTWSDYATALATVQAGDADGLTYILTNQDPFAAIDLDHCRDDYGSVDIWAQNFLGQARHTYAEISPSGTGLRIWGLTDGGPVNRKFPLAATDTVPRVTAGAGFELFRRTHKALTVTGLDLRQGRTLGSIDRIFDWAVVIGERHRPQPTAGVNGVPFNSTGVGSCYTVDQIDQMLRYGAVDGANRSDLFHTVVGHFRGVGETPEQILARFEEFPNGIADRYVEEGRLTIEVIRSLGKYLGFAWTSDEIGTHLAQFSDGGIGGELISVGQLAGATAPARRARQPHQLDVSTWTDSDWNARAQRPELELEQREPEPEPEQQEPELDLDSEPDELEDDEIEQPDPKLPPMYCHGDPDPRPMKNWAIKELMPVCGHGLLAGQWGTFKSFIALELAGALMTGQPFLGRLIKRQCGVLFLAAEGADEMRLRLDALVREKCGGMPRAPFRWYESVPVLLQPGAVEKLIAMARQADNSLQAEFGLPLGLIVIDTIAATAGYSLPGAENDNAVGQALMNVLKGTAQQLNCFSLGVDHFGKDASHGIRGGSSKEASGDLVLACLGDRELGGRVVNTRIAIRKCRGGPQGLEFPFTVRVVESSDRDEDNDPISTLVIDWQIGPGPSAGAQAQSDPWERCRRADQRTTAVRLKRVLMTVLAEHGMTLPTSPNGPTVRMVDREIVRAEFYARTAADGTPEQKAELRRQQFFRATNWAEEQGLIGTREIEGVDYLWLARPDSHEEEGI